MALASLPVPCRHWELQGGTVAALHGEAGAGGEAPPAQGTSSRLVSALPADGSWRAARTYPMAAPQLPQVMKEAFRWTLKKFLPRYGLCKAL